ncbi:hypothetical protein JHL18_15400 [Clostridium sp. YIM B02505]|uniref:Uncharacterized protein n=1 Tax=Clostridium yunnanense TaxID=2800325 RepID=A0ABS1ERK8_9CLOT|nr:hypothetical protein [Clostridium yunnanense]MBK1812007.1 hypothetical protein [Clostridium yunnanense]
MEALFQIIYPVIYFIGPITLIITLYILYKLIRKIDNMLNGKLSRIYASWRNMSKAKKRVCYLFLGALLVGYLCYDMIYLPNKNYKFAIYEVQSMGGNTLEGTTLSYKPFLTEDDIKSYDWNNHTFELKKHIRNYSNEAKKLGYNNRAFVLVVNGEKIYIGGFYKGGPNIYLTLDNKKGSLFYTGAEGYDTRSDERIYKVLKACGKL